MNISPGNAAFLSLLVPGLSHFLQQKPVRGVVALLSCAGLFFLGHSMLGDRLWHFVWFPPFEFLAPFFKIFPLNLWPEWFNLGPSMLASLLQESHSDSIAQANMLRLRRVPVEGEHLALFLTAGSAVISFLFAADAYYLSEQRAAEAEGKAPLTPRKNPAWMAFLSWLLPGSGHWQLGQKGKGLLMGGAVLALFVMALLFSHGHAIDRQHSPAYWIGQIPFGGGVLIASLLLSPREITSLPPDIDLGITLGLVAGIMNLVLMIDAYTVAERSGQPHKEPMSEFGDAPAAATAEGGGS